MVQGIRSEVLIDTGRWTWASDGFRVFSCARLQGTVMQFANPQLKLSLNSFHWLYSSVQYFCNKLSLCSLLLPMTTDGVNFSSD